MDEGGFQNRLHKPILPAITKDFCSSVCLTNILGLFIISITFLISGSDPILRILTASSIAGCLISSRETPDCATIFATF